MIKRRLVVHAVLNINRTMDDCVLEENSSWDIGKSHVLTKHPNHPQPFINPHKYTYMYAYIYINHSWSTRSTLSLQSTHFKNILKLHFHYIFLIFFYFYMMVCNALLSTAVSVYFFICNSIGTTWITQKVYFKCLKANAINSFILTILQGACGIFNILDKMCIYVYAGCIYIHYAPCIGKANVKHSHSLSLHFLRLLVASVKISTIKALESIWFKIVVWREKECVLYTGYHTNAIKWWRDINSEKRDTEMYQNWE